MRNHHAKIKRYTSYSGSELITVLLYGLLIGFIFSFNKWGVDAFDPVVGLFNLGYYILISLFILFAVTYVQKIVGAHIGIIPTFRFSTATFIIPIVLLVFTNGTFPFFIPPGFMTREELSQMLGRNRYRRGFVDYLQIGASGALFVIIMGILFSTAFLSTIFPGVGVLCFYFALFSLLPLDLLIKPFDKKMGVSNGSGILFCSRSIYVFSLLFLLIGFILSLTKLFFFSVLLTIVLAFLGAILYFLFEKKVFS